MDKIALLKFPNKIAQTYSYMYNKFGQDYLMRPLPSSSCNKGKLWGIRISQFLISNLDEKDLNDAWPDVEGLVANFFDYWEDNYIDCQR